MKGCIFEVRRQETEVRRKPKARAKANPNHHHVDAETRSHWPLFKNQVSSVLVSKLFQLALLVGRELVLDVYQQRDLGPLHLALYGEHFF